MELELLGTELTNQFVVKLELQQIRKCWNFLRRHSNFLELEQRFGIVPQFQRPAPDRFFTIL